MKKSKAMVFLLAALCLTGCSTTSSKQEEPRADTYGEKENEVDNKQTLEKMSSEETKNLKIGDRIDKMPDLNLLEQNGMAALVEYEEKIYKEKDNKELELVETTVSYTPVEEKITETSKYEKEINEIKHISESTYKGVVICGIIGIYDDENGKESIEILAPDNIIYIFDMVDQKNLDKVKQLLGVTE